MKINNIFYNVSLSKKQVKYFFIVFVFFLFFLIINLPATVVFSFVKLPNNIKLTSVIGTVWSGSAGKLNVSSINLGAVRWSLHPLNLILGEISADVSIVNNEQFIKTEVSVSYSGKFELEETRFFIDLSLLQPLTYGMPFSYSGNASGYFPVSFFHKNNHIGLNGKLTLSDMKMLAPYQQLFGDFIVDFRSEKGGATSGKLTSSSEILNLAGKLNINKNGQFNLLANVELKEESGSLDKALSFLGRRDANGRVQLSTRVKLWH